MPEAAAELVSGIHHMAVLLWSPPDDSGSFLGFRQAKPSVRRELRPRIGPLGTKKPCCMVIKAQISRRFPAHADGRVHVAVAVGGARKAAILCMIAANNCRGIATSAIWNVT